MELNSISLKSHGKQVKTVKNLQNPKATHMNCKKTFSSEIRLKNGRNKFRKKHYALTVKSLHMEFLQRMKSFSSQPFGTFKEKTFSFSPAHSATVSKLETCFKGIKETKQRNWDRILNEGLWNICTGTYKKMHW